MLVNVGTAQGQRRALNQRSTDPSGPFDIFWTVFTHRRVNEVNDCVAAVQEYGTMAGSVRLLAIKAFPCSKSSATYCRWISRKRIEIGERPMTMRRAWRVVQVPLNTELNGNVYQASVSSCMCQSAVNCRILVGH